ncbi:MAG: hypothetical protein LBM92_02995 [Opitutaceae bacterium]|jgi:hypothetical protein|nr:hypothetical protein [Opitutaceae bacterium]
MTRLEPAKHAAAALGTLFAAGTTAINTLTDALPHLATAAAAFSGLAAGVYYCRKVWLSFRQPRK